MPRKVRILVPHCHHHIVQRGHNRKTVFLVNEDSQFYLDDIKECNAVPLARKQTGRHTLHSCGGLIVLMEPRCYCSGS